MAIHTNHIANQLPNFAKSPWYGQEFVNLLKDRVVQKSVRNEPLELRTFETKRHVEDR